ncbi:MAG: DUF1800 domain-containing protein [Bacteroidota bacterium]
MKQYLLALIACFTSHLLLAQQYTDYIGAGHNAGVTVITSHNQNNTNNGGTTVDGFPLDQIGQLKDASRFLAQATLGYDYEMIERVAQIGYEAWIDEQLAIPQLNMTDMVEQIEASMSGGPDAFGGMMSFRIAWWNWTLKRPDLLRQRVTHALSQIFVISSVGSDLFEDHGELSTYYFDVLNRNAFGNYRQLLSEVSRNPSMGLYLSHMFNPKSDPANNIHPDENYAREVMQLFSIGLYELNNDGTRKLDASGNFIPTYNNADIREFAKIFTGFGNGIPGHPWGVPMEDGLIAMYPMAMFEEWHEPGSKTLLNGQIVPAGQTGLQDFNDAMDNLHNHPNVGPFIGKALIQFLVSSNPSPAYVNRVANAFNDNGQGVRGDLKAVVKAILLDEEARQCDVANAPYRGKLREPIVRYSGFMRAFNAEAIGNSGEWFATTMDDWLATVGQVPLFASSVFNFYSPEYQPNGPIADQNLVAPVFQIHNSTTSIGFINNVQYWTFEELPFIDAGEHSELPSEPILDFDDEWELADNPTALVDRLDILLACGQLSDASKTIIVNALSQLIEEDRLAMALYLILISPDYAFLK